jgi:hypothetical protein
MDTDYLTLALAVTALLLSLICAAVLAGDAGSGTRDEDDDYDAASDVTERRAHAASCARFRTLPATTTRGSASARSLLH